MELTVYADNAATTRLSKAALDAMLPYFIDICGNPSSVHSLGQRAREAVDAARETVAECLGCTAREVIFTSGGSEADNQAILSAARQGAAMGKRHIVTTAFEHHAVLHALRRPEDEGFEVTVLPVREGQNVTAAQVEAALRPDTCLVSVMAANNEIGSVPPVGEIGAVCRRAGVIFHTDAVQAVGHIPVDMRAQSIDMLSLSAHKFHGPKGVGALIVRHGLPLTPLILGGAQERGFRAGTENVAGICGMAAALREACAHMEENTAHVGSMRDYLIERLCRIPGSVVNGDPAHRLPGIVSVCFDGVAGESLIPLLDMRGICASSGAACAAGATEPSHVLLAIGRTRAQARGALRLSLSKYNTMAQAEYIAQVVPAVVEHLRR